MKIGVFRTALCALLFCGGGVAASADEPLAPPRPAGTPPEGFVAHEWGTFTSVQGSDGRSLIGLHHEEERLPGFVGGRARRFPPFRCREPKCLEFRPAPEYNLEVTQSLETPVLFFYSGAALSVDVRVDFPRGLISQWYPDPVAFTPAAPIVVGHVKQLEGGSMTWKVDVLANAATAPRLAPVPAQSIYSPSRSVGSNYVVGHAGGSEQFEKFVFYRGVGQFDAPLTIRSLPGGRSLEIVNDASTPIPAAFLLRFESGQGDIEALGAVDAHGRVVKDVPVLTPASPHAAVYQRKASWMLHLALVQSGLYDDEAWALIDTWQRSYFGTPGVKVLYVMPRAEADGILPITMTPAPRALVRTFVGRIEVLTVDEEQSLLARIRQAMGTPAGFDPGSLGRMAEPKLRRAAQLTSEPKERDYIEGLIAKLP